MSEMTQPNNSQPKTFVNQKISNSQRCQKSGVLELELKKGIGGHIIAKCPELCSNTGKKSDAIVDVIEFMEPVLEESGGKKVFQPTIRIQITCQNYQQFLDIWSVRA